MRKLRITVDTNSIQTDFLDVTPYLISNKYWPFRKPNDQPVYLNVQSNYSPMVIKQIPAMIEKRISANSFNEIEFARSLPLYNQVLRKNGYKTELTFNPNSSFMKPSQHRKYNIIWFNSPFNYQVSTNIGKAFFHLLRKHFPSKIGYTKSVTKVISNLAIAVHLAWKT